MGVAGMVAECLDGPDNADLSMSPHADVIQPTLCLCRSSHQQDHQATP
jgi:hypothetical protein